MSLLALFTAMGIAVLSESRRPSGVHGVVVTRQGGVPLRIQVELESRLPRTTIVGLPASVVRELHERVRSAIVAAGYQYPRQRVIVTVDPTEIPSGSSWSSLDLPIAIAILEASGQIPPSRGVWFGELSLDGKVRQVRGSVAAGRAASEIGMPILSASAPLAALYGAQSFAIDDLHQLQTMIGAPEPVAPYPVELAEPHLTLKDIPDVQVRNALVAAGKRLTPLLLIGPPGVGKTMIAARAPQALDPLLESNAQLQVIENLDTTGILPPAEDGVQFVSRPFRAPHHTVSAAGLVGSRQYMGEAQIAQFGVLFLDEIEEFSRASLEPLGAVLRTMTVGHPWVLAATTPEAIERARWQMAMIFGDGSWEEIRLERWARIEG